MLKDPWAAKLRVVRGETWRQEMISQHCTQVQLRNTEPQSKTTTVEFERAG